MRRQRGFMQNNGMWVGRSSSDERPYFCVKEETECKNPITPEISKNGNWYQISGSDFNKVDSTMTGI